VEGLVDLILEVFVAYFFVGDGDEEAVAEVGCFVGGCVVEGVCGYPGVGGEKTVFDVSAGRVFGGGYDENSHGG